MQVAGIVVFICFLKQVAMQQSDTTLPAATTTAATTATESAITSTTATTPATRYPHKQDVPCNCDLKQSSCDYNCCCDTDCSDTERRYFTECSATTEPLLSRNSYYCQNFNSFFCIYRDNVKKVTVFEDLPLSETTTIKNRFSWDSITKQSITKQSRTNQQNYKYGSPILVLESDTIQTLSIPCKWNSHDCNAKKTVKFLENFGSICRVKVTNLTKMCTSHSHWDSSFIFSQNLSIFRYPYLALNSDVKNAENFIKIQTRLCSDATECQLVSSLSSPVWNSTTETCSNVVKNLVYKFKFDAVSGIVSVMADIELQNLTLSSEIVSTNFNVIFDEKKVFMRSGNPGYQLGRPVLARNSNSTNSAAAVTIATPIRFGIDSYTVSALSQPIGNGSLNPTDRCSFWRETLWSLLLGAKFENESSLLIGAYGDGGRNRTDDWLPLTSHEDLKNCGNGQFVSRIVVSYAKVGLKSNPQNKIKSFLVNLTRVENLVYHHTPTLEILVKFVDVSANPKTVLQRPPRIRISLPNDFFYPFSKSSSSSVEPPYVFVVFLTFCNAIFCLI